MTSRRHFLAAVFAALFIISIPSSYSSEANLKSYYNQLFLGEKKTTNYHGPLNPNARFSQDNGELILIDDLFASHYLDNSIQDEPFTLYQFWFDKVRDKSTCPDLNLGENIDYIRYLYRLLSISYLFESIKIEHKAIAQLGGKNQCALDYKEIFGDCQPESSDMKKFHERAYGKFVNEYSKITVASFSTNELKDWLASFSKSNSLTSDPLHARLHEWCVANQKNCRAIGIDEIKSTIKGFCDEDRETIKKLCNEKDSLYGISYAEKATDLIQSSNAFNLINQSGMGEDCLRRYVKLFSSKEIKYGSLGRLYPLIYAQLARENRRYLQGDLFLPGALKEFDIKGLSDFLIALKPPKIEVVKALPKPKPKPKPKVVVPVVVKVDPTPKPEPQVVVEPKPELPNISEFESAVKELDEKKLETLSINMDKFRDDYEFDAKTINDLSAPIKKFQTRSALLDMKSYDHLGSRDAPVGIVFLKYLIDTENHQGLYNITSVLGEKFYVFNDFEKKERPVFIELRNDQSTKYRWQIIITKSPKQPH